MSIESFPFTSVNGDRPMTAAQFRAYWSSFASDGIIPNLLESCAVSANGLTVTVSSGAALIQGAMAMITAPESITVAATSTERYAAVVLEYNTNAEYRDIHLNVIYGTTSNIELTKTVNVWQLPLCSARIPANASSLSDFTDQRTWAELRITDDYGAHLKDTSNPHKVTPEQISAAASNHSHTPADIGAATSSHSHTPASIGAAASSHTHDERYYTETETDALLKQKAPSSHTHSYLPLSGGTLTGVLKLTSGVHYGTSLPSAGNAGRIFFKKV